MPEIEMREATRHHRPPDAVPHGVSVVQGKVADELLEGARVALLSLGFGVGGVGEDAEVEANQGIEDCVVGRGVVGWIAIAVAGGGWAAEGMGGVEAVMAEGMCEWGRGGEFGCPWK